MNSDPKPILSNDLLDALSEALGFPYAQRIVIDVQYGKFAEVYIQSVADERLLRIDWTGDLKDAKIVIVENKDDGK